ncbi:hypothetical protein RN001_002358 [Aquatica leii]|uniref:Uncharacterized protein n=1 Tax=Aquatica leii TaxID=1421715 RepID=A0AAN7Q8L1_9COLE|nr:hypothetical protein RN001_002358 [Aquatica leii]
MATRQRSQEKAGAADWGCGRGSRGSIRNCIAGSSNLTTCGSSTRRQNRKERTFKIEQSSDALEPKTMPPLIIVSFVLLFSNIKAFCEYQNCKNINYVPRHDRSLAIYKHENRCNNAESMFFQFEDLNSMHARFEKMFEDAGSMNMGDDVTKVCSIALKDDGETCINEFYLKILAINTVLKKVG